MAFAEPIGTREDVALAAHRLIAAACDRLAQAHEGARRLELTAFRADGTTARATVGTGRPVRDPRHLERLFTEKLDTVDAGFGIDAMVLAVTAADPLAPEQAGLDAGKHGRDGADSGLARLIDRLGNRLGAAGVRAIVPRASHVPERAWRAVAMLPERPGNPPTDAAMAGRPEDARRPIHLLAPPEPIDAVAPVPDGPPAAFRWRRRQHRVARAEGPERIGPEWWTDRSEILHQGEMRRRDYYRIEDDAGGRFWVFREGPYRPGIRPKWYLHGLFP